jgi:hypothetical protein
VQSHVPASYVTLFDVPGTRELTEWSLIGGKDAISSMHVDTEGFATSVLVLEGSKYWIIATQIGDHEDIAPLTLLAPTGIPTTLMRGAMMVFTDLRWFISRREI